MPARLTIERHKTLSGKCMKVEQLKILSIPFIKQILIQQNAAGLGEVLGNIGNLIFVKT
jgi:hypothetical protein